MPPDVRGWIGRQFAEADHPMHSACAWSITTLDKPLRNEMAAKTGDKARFDFLKQRVALALKERDSQIAAYEADPPSQEDRMQAVLERAKNTEEERKKTAATSHAHRT